ncbi:uncharacterized protein BP5553_10004 [Venustampulla echinocandica]|uniref:Uncharacterized protein n=1 Tax=Venustampulla echinocandica TaxID=2656787 RepID=A0A370TA21_9HELO|nr:uncharacterized protein BP5553_10004 [Venustampulla echinocandica]RDL30659.1 hypothetical protein BP5553_10004 [Venustampulla echinocandica]
MPPLSPSESASAPASPLLGAASPPNAAAAAHLSATAPAPAEVAVVLPASSLAAAAVLNPLPALPARPTNAMLALTRLPPVRNTILRPGRTFRSAAQSANTEAALAQAVGSIAVVQCTHCSRSSGIWVGCVVVAGFLSGSCANGHYGSEGARHYN